MGIIGHIGAEHHLDNPASVPQINKDQSPVVPSPEDPSCEADHRAYVRLSQFPAFLIPHHNASSLLISAVLRLYPDLFFYKSQLIRGEKPHFTWLQVPQFQAVYPCPL